MCFLAGKFEFEGTILAAASEATFKRRRTQLPDDLPFFLSDDHAASPTTAKQWQAFVSRSMRDPDPEFLLIDVVAMCRGFVMPVVQGLTQRVGFVGAWGPSGPWQTVGGSG